VAGAGRADFADLHFGRTPEIENKKVVRNARGADVL
jgi:hypothetical protein